MQAMAARPLWAYLWAAPATLVGLLACVLVCWRGARMQLVDGVLEVAPRYCRRRTNGPRFIAITLGHVILGESTEVLARWRRHERVHVRQFEQWGILFFLAYPAAGVWAWLCGRRPYWDNVFEIAARRAELE